MAFLILQQLVFELIRFVYLLFRSPAALAAENIALRAQLEVCARCRHKRRRIPDAAKVLLVALDRLYRVRNELVQVTPRTVRGWAKRVSTFAFWLRARRMGRPPLTREEVALIQRLARENPTWSAGLIARTARRNSALA